MSFERRRIRQETIADLERAVVIVHSRVASGMAPRYDASRIQIAVEQAQASLGDVEADIARARGELDIAVGPATADLVGSPRVDAIASAEPPALPSLDEALAAARRRPDVVAAQRRIEAASFEIDAAKRAVFPGIGLRVGAGYGQSTGQVDFAAGVTVPLPLLERGQGTVRSAQARAEASRFVAEALGTAVLQRVQAAHIETAKRIAALARFRDKTGSLSEGLRAQAEAGYREAKLTVLELVDAFDSLRDARLRLLELTETVHLASIALGRAVGQGLPFANQDMNSTHQGKP